MADKDLADLLKKQVSLTEWLQGVEVDYIDTFRKEDTGKRRTLGDMAEIIGWPIESNVTFSAVDVQKRGGAFGNFLQKNEKSLYAMRLLPKKPGLEKLRLRGISLGELMNWFDQQQIQHDEYEVNLIDHPPDHGWAAIFFVNQHGIHGEMIYGGHHLLTQGFHGENLPIVFHYDFKKWYLSQDNESALAYIKHAAEYLKITDETDKKNLADQYGATFVNNYLAGYFETTDSSLGLWYIDYNQTLGEKLADASFRTMLQDNTAQGDVVLRGRSGSPGKVSGRVRLVQDPSDQQLKEGEILVCTFTSPDYLECMQKSAAIITDQGGTLSHAAIVARELQTPCIVATGNATEILVDGDMVTVDAHNGVVTRLVLGY